MLMDLSCGFQSVLASGTRSRVFRVVPISWSNSGSIASRIGILEPPVVFRLPGLYSRGVDGGSSDDGVVWRQRPQVNSGQRRGRKTLSYRLLRTLRPHRAA